MTRPADVDEVRLDVVVVGDVMVDVLVEVRDARAHGSDTPSRIATAPGGGGANQAAWLAGHGCAVALVGCVGSDPLGAAARRALEAAGVDVTGVATVQGPTGTVVALVEPDGERTMLTDRAANLSLAPALVEPLVSRLDERGHLHLSGYALLDGATRVAGVRALELAAARGCTRSVDASSTGPLRAVGRDRFLADAADAQLLFCNLDEGQVLTGREDAAGVAASLHDAFDEVVVSLGAAGAVALDGQGRLHAASAGSSAVADTVGAGDALTAAYLAARRSGAGVDAALAEAVAAADAAVASRGARSWSGYSRE